jgi:hypothetical protein
MLDIETFGTRPGSIIRSIGAAVFDLTGPVGKTFYVNVEPKSCLAAGLVIDPATEKGWAEQSAAAQKALLVHPLALKNALEAFSAWFRAQSAPIVWSQGANFDPPLLEAAYTAVGMSAPWKFYNVRDTRTVYHVFGFDTRDLVGVRTHHNALDDAIHQVALVAAALRNGRPATSKPVAGGIFE